MGRVPFPLVLVALAAAALLPCRLSAQAASDTAVVRAQDETEAQRLFGQLMSPFCRGLTLAACPSPGADSLRRDIRARLAVGEAPRSITASYAADWGEQMLGAPPVREWGIVLWTLPGMLLVLGGISLTLWLRTQQRRTGAAVAAEALAGNAPPPVEPAMRKRLEAELEAFDKSL
jgi:cytochrome c-type biogenesis protein CcmH